MAKMKLLKEYAVKQPAWITIWPGVELFTIVEGHRKVKDGEHMRDVLYVSATMCPTFYRITSPEAINPVTPSQEKFMKKVHDEHMQRIIKSEDELENT